MQCQCQCLKCGYIWSSRKLAITGTYPTQCPHCKRNDWMRKKKP